MENKTMLTDLYQLTMNAAYLDNGNVERATFDLFIRGLPTDWGYYVAAGIEDAIEYATSLKFEKEDVDYLRSQNLFKEEFLKQLEGFRFEGDMHAVPEGTVVFPNEPILRVSANRMQAQFLETTLLNMVNFQTMVASKTSRIANAAKGKPIVDFGLRRAHEADAALKGARAAYLGGAVATSNVKAGQQFGIPISGTHAHSFVMSFENELEAFRAYVHTFPDKATLLIDTYDTVRGARNAATVGKELEATGHRLGAVRLDSGDLSGLSKKVREILNDEGLGYVRILASNDLNEYKIDDMLERGAPIDGFGVGTELITAKPTAAIPGVYKLSEDSSGAKMKLSEGKHTLPGTKQVYRVTHAEGTYSHDVVALETEHEQQEGTPQLEQVVCKGRRVSLQPPLAAIRDYSLGCVAKLPEEIRRIRAPARYEVRVSEQLADLANELSRRYLPQK